MTTAETCPRCGESAPLSETQQQGVVFHAPLCAACRDLTVREVLLADFARLMGRIDEAENQP